MSTTTSIEKVITSNPKIGTHPKLEAYTTDYLAALAGGHEPDPALLTDMFAVLVDITTTDPGLNMLLDDLTTEIVEQVIERDENLATNTDLSSMLSYYTEQVENGYEPDEATTTAILVLWKPW